MHAGKEQGKRFFFGKKQQKTFGLLSRRWRDGVVSVIEARLQRVLG